LPHVAVNRDGVLGLSWSEEGTCSRFTASLDGGHTFLPSAPLNECPRRESTTFPYGAHLSAVAAAYNVAQFETPDFQRKAFTIVAERYGGGNGGLTADAAGLFHPSFSINGDGRLWTTRVTVHVEGVPAAPPTPTTQGLTDVSAYVTFNFTELDYDPGTGLLTVELTLINMDSVPIRGPLRVELTRLGSMLFEHLEVVNADNHVAGPGAVWDLTAALPSSGLAAYVTAAPRRLVFRVTDGPKPVNFRTQPSVPLLVADVKIFGDR
jgi:hypothetical protein